MLGLRHTDKVIRSWILVIIIIIIIIIIILFESRNVAQHTNKKHAHRQIDSVSLKNNLCRQQI